MESCLEILPGYGSSDTAKRVDTGDMDLGTSDTGALTTAISEGEKSLESFPSIMTPLQSLNQNRLILSTSLRI